MKINQAEKKILIIKVSVLDSQSYIVDKSNF